MLVFLTRKCQAAHFEEHKPFCRAMKVFEHLMADLPEECRPNTASQFFQQRLNVRAAIEPALRRWVGDTRIYLVMH